MRLQTIGRAFTDFADTTVKKEDENYRTENSANNNSSQNAILISLLMELLIGGNALSECLVRELVVVRIVTAFLCAFSFIIHIPIVLDAIPGCVSLVSHSISVFLFPDAV